MAKNNQNFDKNNHFFKKYLKYQKYPRATSICKSQPKFVLIEKEAVKSMIKARGGVRGQKNKFGSYQSPTCHGVTTFYGIAKSSFMTKIWRVKVQGYYSVPYKI